jgi:GDP-4-dehydro-6-deoxy-D-mannose reductase
LRSHRDFLDVRDVVRAYLLLLERGRRGETYNIASGNARLLKDILDMIMQLHGSDKPIAEDPALVRPPDVLVGDASKLRRETGWKPRIDLEVTLREMLRG